VNIRPWGNEGPGGGEDKSKSRKGTPQIGSMSRNSTCPFAKKESKRASREEKKGTSIKASQANKGAAHVKNKKDNPKAIEKHDGVWGPFKRKGSSERGVDRKRKKSLADEHGAEQQGFFVRKGGRGTVRKGGGGTPMRATKQVPEANHQGGNFHLISQ